MAKESSKSSNGIGLFGLMFIVFLVLKLTQIGVVAKWSWWWVTAPLWMPATIAIVVLIIYFFIKVLSTKE